MKHWWTHCADFREWAKTAGRVADVIIADPPYDVTALWWDRWPVGWIESALSILKPGGSMWCFGSMRTFLEHGGEFSQWFNYAQEIVWEKHNGSNAHRDRFRRVHELAVQWYPGKWKDVYKAPVYSMDAKRRRVHRQKKPAHWNSIAPAHFESEVDGQRLMRSVIYEPSCHGHAINETQKPAALICPLIEHSCPPWGMVVDPFMGSGSTLEAALRTGRHAIGIDIRKDQCEGAGRRLRDV